jgi:hypothetical protein
MEAIEICRTKELGGHIDACEECGHIRISYNSCRNRHCPKCQFLRKEKWLEAREKELLPVPYFHIVFTLPDTLNPLVLRNQKVLYDILFKAASETLIELTGSRIGIIAVLHTWGQNLMDHPHLHCIVTGGGLSDGRWVPSKKKFFRHVKVISRLFRGKFLFYLKKTHEKGDLRFPGLISHLEHTFTTFLRPLYAREWVVYCTASFGGPESVIRYLGRYTHRVAIANHRIVGVENGTVSFTYKDYADGDKKKTMTLDAHEFIRRFLLHVLPDGFVKIRYFGLLANRKRRTNLELCRRLLGVKKDDPKEETWQGSLLRITGIDVTVCPVCQGKMRTTELIRPVRGPP